MIIFTRLLALFLLGLFSLQTLAGPSLELPVSERKKENVTYLKSTVFSASTSIDHNTKRFSSELSDIQTNVFGSAGNSISLVNYQILQYNSFISFFDLNKDHFLSPVNLIFPFQYFW